MLTQLEALNSEGLELFIDDAMWRIDTNAAGAAADQGYIDKQKNLIREAANILQQRGHLKKPYSQYVVDIEE